ncbi:MAG: AI-2E family transporter [Lachnospiraceae bacterium]|nr:AI-2E family transporter [Lachnospiraceae bacterium]MDD3615848.1 AI-2E family transporter [Lachnospiraceae bacterium]
MKFKWDKKYLYWGVTAFSVLVAGLLLYYVLFRMDTIFNGFKKIYGILMPIIFGGIIAYLLVPVIKFIEKTVVQGICERKKWTITEKTAKIVRMVSVIFALVFLIFIVYGLLAMLIPQILTSITTIIENFPRYVDTVQKWVNNFLKNEPEIDAYATTLFTQYSSKAQEWLSNEFLPQINNIVINFSSGVFDIINVLKNILIGMIISIYILYNKEKFAAIGKRVLFSLIRPALANNILNNLRFVNQVFGGFISGKILDSCIIGILCYIGTSMMGTPYALLVSVIVGVTNVIPFFGPYIGAVPSAFLILLVNPMQCLYFIIFILVLQQLDGNVIGPKILGNSTGLSSFMVIVAILVGGGLFGIIGMFIGVPVCAVICALANQSMNHRLENKNLPVDLEVYKNMDYLDTDTNQPVAFGKEQKKVKLQKMEKKEKS